MAQQFMHWLIKYTNKQSHAHSDYALQHGRIIQQPSLHIISSNKFSANYWNATATYVGWLLNINIPCYGVYIMH